MGSTCLEWGRVWILCGRCHIGLDDVRYKLFSVIYNLFVLNFYSSGLNLNNCILHISRGIARIYI